MNMSRDSFGNQFSLPPHQMRPSLPNQGTPVPFQAGPTSQSQQGPPNFMGNPVYRPWFLLPPPPPPSQTHPGPTTINNSSPSTSYGSQNNRIDTSKPPPLLPQQLRNGTVQRIPNEEGQPYATQTTFQPSPSRPEQEIFLIDTTKPPPIVKSLCEKRHLPDSHAGPSKSRKIDTESTTCENCLQWDLRNLEVERKKKDKLKEKGILVLRLEEKKKEIADIVDTLKGLQTDNSNKESFDLATMDLRYALLDRDIFSKTLDGPEFNSHTPSPVIAAGSSGHGPSTSSAPLPPSTSGPTAPSATPAAAYSQPPPARPHFPLAYRPPATHFTQYFPGPSSSSPVNNFSIPPPALPPSQPPYDPNYYNMMGRPPPSFT